MTAQMTAVHLDNVTKSFAGVQVIKGISLSIRKGEFVSLLGPSGCGKTTLLRMIAGLEEATSGSIHIGGTDSTRLPPEQRDIAMVFQSYALLPHLTVLENVMFPLRMRKLGDRAEQRERAEAVLHLVQLSPLAQRRPRQLSGGQQQRVAVARAIVSSPKVLLLDEPMSNLDARLRESMQEELIQIHRKTGLTTVFVTHDQEEALEVANRVVVMDKGKIEQIGTPGDVYDNPATAFVHGFIGESIVLPVQVSDGKVRLGEKILNLEPRDAVSGPSNLFIRRHDVSIVPAGSGILEGDVKHVRAFGPTQRADVVLHNGASETLIEIDAPRDRDLKPGDVVSLQPRRYRLFPAGA